MSTFGRTVIDTIGRSVQVTADGKPMFKAGGVTIDWTTVAPIAGAPVTWLDGLVMNVGDVGLRYGQVICRITASGNFGPYDPAAADGRQLLNKGDCYFLNESVRQDEVASDHPPAMYGGLCFINRVLQSGVAAHTLALGPTLAEFLAAFPLVQPVNEAA